MNSQYGRQEKVQKLVDFLNSDIDPLYCAPLQNAIKNVIEIGKSSQNLIARQQTLNLNSELSTLNAKKPIQCVKLRKLLTKNEQRNVDLKTLRENFTRNRCKSVAAIQNPLNMTPEVYENLKGQNRNSQLKLEKIIVF